MPIAADDDRVASGVDEDESTVVTVLDLISHRLGRGRWTRNKSSVIIIIIVIAVHATTRTEEFQTAFADDVVAIAPTRWFFSARRPKPE